MTQQEYIEEIGRKDGSTFRRVARILIVACGLMIGLVVLSDPRVTGAARDALAGMQGNDVVVTRHDTETAFSGLIASVPLIVPESAPEETPQEAARPRVSVLPESRVNVIRLTD